ncbi:hypothetical protein [Streptomyces sp. HUAS TT7]|uniref:hypothetical protein n=1 Tax=Streptomyces sp. HUAS TT7 TaxID=3447507 RepID=UPI003F659EDC
MGRVSEETRQANEAAIRVAMDRMLSGDLPEGGKCDIKTLAALSGVVRTGFYPKRGRDGAPRPGPYQHLAEEFERRLAAVQASGTVPDPRVAQIERLKARNSELERRVKDQDAEITRLSEFRQLALSRIAAQHLEIERLREQAEQPAAVRQLPQPRRRTSDYLPPVKSTAPYGSCS